MFDPIKSQSLMNVIVALCLACFFVGAFISGMQRWFSPIIALHVSNDTGADLRELRITGRIEEDEVRIFRTGIPKGDTVTIEMLAGAGGLGFTAEATLPNGTVTKPVTNYINGDASISLKAPE